MPSGNKQKIVADGEAAWWRSEEGIAESRRIEADVRARYEAELERAGRLKRVLLELRIRREIAAERLEVLWAAAEAPNDAADPD